MGQGISAETRFAGLRVVDVVRGGSESYFADGECDWGEVVRLCERQEFGKEVKELRCLLELYRDDPAAFDRERLFLTGLAKAWSVQARLSACGEGSGLKCAGLGRIMTVVLAAAVHGGLRENEVLFLFGKLEGGASNFQESEELLGKAVLHNATSAAVDVIVSCADPVATNVAVELALVLCSGQIFSVPFFRIVIDKHPRSEHLLARLITLASSAVRRKTRSSRSDRSEDTGTMALGVAHVRLSLELLAVVSPTTTATFLRSSGEELQDSTPKDPSELAASLLAVLCAADWSGPYRSNLNELANASRKEPLHESGTGSSLTFPFRTLFDSLASWLRDERGAVLCYVLLTGNRRFRSFALARTDPETLVAPLLRLATKSVRGRAKDPHSVALVMSILLVLTESETFVEAMGAVIVSHQQLRSFGDALLTTGRDSTLAECVLVIAVLVLRYTASKAHLHRDLVGLSLAVAANVARQLTEVSQALAERIVKVLELMTKSLNRLLIEEQGEDSNTDGAKGTTDASPVEAISQCTEHVSLLLELIEMLVRSTLSRNLVYTMLHQKHVFCSPPLCELPLTSNEFVHCTAVSLRTYSMLRELSASLEAARADSAEEVLSIIGAKLPGILDPSELPALPALKFEFEPIPMQGEFFQRFAWMAATRHLDSKWDLSRCSLKLNHASPPA